MKTPTSHSDGFTLLELMMVLLLLGLLVGVGLTLDFSGSPSSQRQVAAQVAEQLQLAALEAVQSGNPWGLDFFTQSVAGGSTVYGYRWLWHDGMRWQEAEASLIHAAAFDYVLPAGLDWQLAVDGAPLQAELLQPLTLPGKSANPRFRPEIVLTPARQATSFTLQLCASAHQGCTAVVSADELGRVEVRDTDASR